MAKHLQTSFLAACLILIGFNACQLIVKLVPDRPIAFAGIKFAGLNEILQHETHIGYITDLNIDEDKNLAEFEQAQYMLAPAILELNNAKTRFLIVNCSNDEAAFQKLKEIGAQPLKRNPYGIILAQNPSGFGL
jgi:hypothetical protein